MKKTVYPLGHQSKAICHHCLQLVTTVLEKRDVPLSDGAGVIRQIDAFVHKNCAGQDRVVAIPAQSTPEIKRQRDALLARENPRTDDYVPLTPGAKAFIDATLPPLKLAVEKMHQRYHASDMLRGQAVCQRRPEFNLATLGHARIRGRVVAINTGKGVPYHYPEWQFQEKLWPTVQRLGEALDTREGWVLLNFLETPLGGLDNRTPRQALEQGEAERVLYLAQTEGF